MPLPRYTSNQLYRRLHVGHPTDTEIYERLCAGADRILDLGCGWGRIALCLAESGRDVVGVDIEPEFLDECRQQLQARGLSKQLHVYQADMCSAELGSILHEHGPFERVLFSYNTIYALGGRERFAQCLRALLAHLTPDAEVWLDAYDVDDFHHSFDAEQVDDAGAEQDTAIASWDDSEETIEAFEASEAWSASQRLTVHYQARVLSTGQCVGEQTLVHDYLLSRDLGSIFDAAGYDLVGCYPRSALVRDAPDPGVHSDDGVEQLFYVAVPSTKSP